MRAWKVAGTIGCALVLSVALAQARSHHHHHARSNKPGVFDYYVLSLSWSPQHCASHDTSASDPQCGSHRKYAFVVHGLWPQYESGFPQSCASGGGLDQTVVDSVTDIMPSPALIRHEWAKHGTCSGMDPATYFGKVRAAYSALKIPAAYQNPGKALRIPASQIKEGFEQANSGVGTSDLAVLCSGKFLEEVRVCFDKNLHPRNCGPDVRDHCGSEVVVRPVR